MCRDGRIRFETEGRGSLPVKELELTVRFKQVYSVPIWVTMTLCLIGHESRISQVISLNQFWARTARTSFLYCNRDEAGTVGVSALGLLLGVSPCADGSRCISEKRLRGCAGFRPLDCINRNVRGVDTLRCRPRHNRASESVYGWLTPTMFNEKLRLANENSQSLD